MTQYKAGQTVEITTGDWDGDKGWSKGSQITLVEHIPENAIYGGEWRADDRYGTRGIIEEKNFKPLHASPVRTETVTTRRIVPGVYGRIQVNGPNPHDPKQVDLGFVYRGAGAGNDKTHVGYCLTATELDELAMVASQLAEALRDHPQR